MSKKIKTIIWSGVALVVLIAVTIALVLTAPSQSGEGSSNVSVDTIALIRETYSDVESMHIKNQNDDYTIELVGEELWRIRDTMDLKQITYMYEQTLTYMSTFSAVEVIEEDCADLSRYGLMTRRSPLKASIITATSIPSASVCRQRIKATTT